MPHHLQDAAERSIRYVQQASQQRLYPQQEIIDALDQFVEDFPETPTDPGEIIEMLDELGSPATIPSTGGRYFGFVTGGILPAALAASWMIAAWDQNGGLRAMSPVTSTLEDLSVRWLLDVFGFPQEYGVGLVTGATMANFVGLAAARHHLLRRAGWDVEEQGLFGAPEIKVVIGEEAHASLVQALGMVGLGTKRVIRVPADEQGRMIASEVPELDEMTILCLQAGNVNSGAFDPADEICDKAKQSGAWIHVDGAFGLWVLATPELKHLGKGLEKADSWATDGHKWLNVSYDNGIAFCRHPKAMRAALSISAPYLMKELVREPLNYTPENSRRARGIEIWAALKSLGRSGLAEMIERNCQQARRFATGLEAAGFTIHNDVVLNQVVVSFGDAETTKKVIEISQKEGTMWAGSTVWKEHTAMRISVSSWATTDEDIDRSLEALIQIAQEVTSG